MQHKAEWLEHPMRHKLTREGLLVKLANLYTIWGAQQEYVVYYQAYRLRLYLADFLSKYHFCWLWNKKSKITWGKIRQTAFIIDSERYNIFSLRGWYLYSFPPSQIWYEVIDCKRSCTSRNSCVALRRQAINIVMPNRYCLQKKSPGIMQSAK